MDENYFHILVETRKILVQNRLYELLTNEKFVMLDVFKDYWVNDSELNQKEWILDYLVQEFSCTFDLAVFLYDKHKDNKYLEINQ